MVIDDGTMNERTNNIWNVYVRRPTKSRLKLHYDPLGKHWWKQEAHHKCETALAAKHQLSSLAPPVLDICFIWHQWMHFWANCGYYSLLAFTHPIFCATNIWYAVWPWTRNRTPKKEYDDPMISSDFRDAPDPESDSISAGSRFLIELWHVMCITCCFVRKSDCVY